MIGEAGECKMCGEVVDFHTHDCYPYIINDLTYIDLITINRRVSRKLFEKIIVPRLKELEATRAENKLLKKGMSRIANEKNKTIDYLNKELGATKGQLEEAALHIDRMLDSDEAKIHRDASKFLEKLSK